MTTPPENSTPILSPGVGEPSEARLITAETMSPE